MDVIKKFKGQDSQPFTMDANKNYLVVGDVAAYESVVVHSRNEFDQSGFYQKVMVSELRSSIQLL